MFWLVLLVTFLIVLAAFQLRWKLWSPTSAVNKVVDKIKEIAPSRLDTSTLDSAGNGLPVSELDDWNTGDPNFLPMKPGSIGGCGSSPGHDFPNGIVVTEDLLGNLGPTEGQVTGIGLPDESELSGANLVGASSNLINAYKINPFRDFGAIDIGLSSVAMLDEAVDYDTIISNTRYQRINKGTSDLRAPPLIEFDRSAIPIGAAPCADAYFPSRDYYPARTFVV